MRTNAAGQNLGGASPVHYPGQLREAEAAAVAARRRLVAEDAPEVKFADGAIGLALSGGGVRSATFNLGILQGLARRRLLRLVDYLSTVSGGGYIGGFLGRFYTRFVNRPRGAADFVEARLADPAAPEIRWLRLNANYLAPSGVGDTVYNAAFFLRNLLTLHAVLGIALFAFLCLANAARFGFFPWLGAVWDRMLPANFGGLLGLPTPDDLPVTHLLRAGWGFFWSPWMMLVESVLLLGWVPLSLAYWLVSADKPQGFQPAALKATLVLAAALFAAGLVQFDSPRLAPVLVGTSLLGSFAYVEAAWRSVRGKCPGGLAHPITRRMVRGQLTTWLASVSRLGVIVAGFAALDTAGFALYGWVSQREDFARAFGLLGSGLAALYPLLRWGTRQLNEAVKLRGEEKGSPWLRILMHPAVLPFAVSIPPLLLLSLASHALFAKGDHWGPALATTAVAVVISAVLGSRDALPFINRSSLQSVYAARISRAYLGASNYFRQGSVEGQDVTVSDPDDDVRLNGYQPENAGGPLHLINVCVNETIDHYSQRSFRDRHGENLAVGSAGVSIGADWHAAWRPAQGPPGPGGAVLATDPDDLPHPLRGPLPGPVATEPLYLSDWLAISGAAVSPGRGQQGSLGYSLLYGLGNLRTGYWWNSGLDELQRPGLGRPTLCEALLRLPERIFQTQFILLREFTASFAGPWGRFWYLSDGGFFENLALYELIRRRVPYIVASDASYDPKNQQADLANFLRKVRIDFDAEVDFLTAAEIAALPVPAGIKGLLGQPQELRASDDENSQAQKHAAVARIYYDGQSEPGGVILYLKSGLTGDEPADVLSFKRTHPEFPHDPTLDQFFDEAQWESYRKLGDHIAEGLFPDAEVGFWLPCVLGRPVAASAGPNSSAAAARPKKASGSGQASL